MKTIYTNMKRLLVVLLAIGTTNSVLAVKHYAKGVAQVGTAGAGEVAVSTSATVPGTYDATEISRDADCGGGISHGGEHEIQYYFYARTTDNNYLWDGWYNGDAFESSDMLYARGIHVGLGNIGTVWPTSRATVTLTAKWVQPKVTGVSGEQLGTITDPNQTLSGNVVFALSEDKAIDNYTGVSEADRSFAFRLPSYATHAYTIPVVYTATGVDGTYTALYTLTSNYGGSTQTATITAVEDYTPRFTMEAYAFGATSIISSARRTHTPAATTYAAGHATWSAEIEGADAAAFALVRADAATGACEINFAPQEVREDYTATLVLTAVYTDKAGNQIRHEERIALTGSGQLPTEASLFINSAASNPGTYDETTPRYTFLDQYGTVTKTAKFSVGFANVENITYSLSGNTDIFSIAEGTEGTNAQSITISAHTATVVETATTYTTTLTVSATSTVDGTTTIQKQLQLSVTIHPKRTNTLNFNLPLWPGTTSTYYIYTDAKDVYVLRDINNTDTVHYPITISSTSGDYKTYFSINNDTHTLSGIKEAGNRNLTVVQPTSDEYEAAKVTISTFQVKKHSYAWIYPAGTYPVGDGNRLYKNTYYPHIISTDAEQAGVVKLEVEYEDNGVRNPQYPAVKDGTFRQRLFQNEDGTWGMQTGDTITGQWYRTYLEYDKEVVNSTQTETGVVNETITVKDKFWYYTTRTMLLRVKQPGTDHATGREATAYFYIIKDPVHVPVGPSYTASTNATTGVVTKTGLWGNNAAYLYDDEDHKYMIDNYKAEWIGYDWVSSKWTGTYTGKTNWTTVAGQGSTNAFALYDGGYAVFHFLGIPHRTYFTIYFQTETADGTVRLEESADGRTWTEVTKSSTTANYFATSGWKSGYMRPTSRYIRYSYSGANHVVIAGSYIEENTFVRIASASQSVEREMVTDSAAYHALTCNADGSWNPLELTIQAANWGTSGVQWESSNPDFKVEFDQFDAKGGLDQYAERAAKVLYTGSALYASTTIRLTMRGFYGSSTTTKAEKDPNGTNRVVEVIPDTLRSYVFTVQAVGANKTMPQNITYDTRHTTYITGTGGPIRNADRTRNATTTIGNPYGNLQSTDNAYSQGNRSPKSGLREHDFQNCFGTDGQPLFDQLYIFGQTTNNDGAIEGNYNSYYTNEQGDTVYVSARNMPKISNQTNDVGSNAVTPLYRYEKDGNQYTLRQTIANTNVRDQQISLTASGQKVYFSGFCPALSTGYKADEHGGAIYVSGKKGTQVDLYFEDCVIRSRAHTETGRNVNTATDDVVSGGFFDDDPVGMHALGLGSTLLLSCSDKNNASAPFAVNIHLLGENSFRSTSGSPRFGNIGQSCAPIQVMTDGNSLSLDKKYVTITLDDIWLRTADGSQTERTNGGLRLHKTGNTPSIDLGTEYTTVNFAGGRIELQNSIQGSDKYMNTMAIAYRKYQLGINMYGVGSDVDGGTVNFLDGTVSALPLNTKNNNWDCTLYYQYTEQDSNGKEYTVGLDTINHPNGTVSYYTTSLRTPSNTYIKGGSHNVPIRAVTTIGSWEPATGAATSPGNAPTDGDPDPQPVGRLDVTISPDNIDDKGFVKSFVFPDTLGNPNRLNDDGTPETLAQYYKRTGKTYGMESMAPDKNGQIHLWLPLEWLGRIEIAGKKVEKWLEVLTHISVEGKEVAGIGIPDQEIGGDQTVGTEVLYENLLYCTLDDRLYALLNKKGFTLPVWNPAEKDYTDCNIKSADGGLYSVIEDEEDYSFEKGLYYVMVANADLWTTFTPPFDVKQMYVLESYPEALLETMDREAALDLQAEQNAIFAGFVGVGVKLGSEGTSFENFKESFLRWAYKQDTTSGVYPKPEGAEYYPQSYTQAKDYQTDYRGMHELKHLSGSNWDGNFYLYRSKTNTWAYDGERFVTDWEPAPAVVDRDDVMMRKGEIYAMRFPHCYGCDDPTTRDYWDYWTGKLIIMVGEGPQTIAGKNRQEEQFLPYTLSASAALRGNPTFADMQVPNSTTLTNAYFHRDGNSQFEPSTDPATGNIAPGKVFLLANPTTAAGAPTRTIASIHAETGVITYEDGDDGVSTGVPMVSGGRTLLATIEEGALTLIPVVEQDVALYTSAGQLVFAGHLAAEQTFPLPTGIYLVRGEKEQIKVVIR